MTENIALDMHVYDNEHATCMPHVYELMEYYIQYYVVSSMSSVQYVISIGTF